MLWIPLALIWVFMIPNLVTGSLEVLLPQAWNEDMNITSENMEFLHKPLNMSHKLHQKQNSPVLINTEYQPELKPANNHSNLEKTTEVRRRRKRDAFDDAFSITSVCSLSQAEVQKLTSIVQNAYDITSNLDSGSQLSSTTGETNSSSSICQQLILQFRNAVQSMVTKVHKIQVQIKTGALIDLQSLVASQTTIQELQDKFSRLESKFVGQFSQDLAQAKAKFHETNSLIQLKLENAGVKIKSLLEKVQTLKINLVISKIRSGDIELAGADFSDLPYSQDLLTDIIQRVFTGEISQVSNIILFIRRQPSIERDIIAYSALWNKMKSNPENDHTCSPSMLLLAWGINETMTYSNYGTVQQGLKNQIETAKQALDIHVENILQAWAGQIRSGNGQEIENFINISRETKSCFDSYLQALVNRAYGNDKKHFLQCNHFITKTLPYISQAAAGSRYLISTMKSNEHADGTEMLRLSYGLKKLWDRNLNADGRQDLEASRNELPSWAVGLIWRSGRCTIKSKEYGEYLYAASDGFAFSHERRRVFAWIPGGTVSQGYWEFEASGDGTQFVIKSTAVSEYLYASISRHNNDRRLVFTWRPQGRVHQGTWELERQSGGFLIKNTFYMEYLYAASSDFNYNSERRRVFLWIPGGHDSQSRWDIQC